MYADFFIYANFGAWKSQNNEIFGAERGFRGCFCRDQIPTQGTKKRRKEENCRKYATEMNNEQDNRQLLLIFMLFICIYAKKVVPLHAIL